jgi:hypothetical protein
VAVALGTRTIRISLDHPDASRDQPLRVTIGVAAEFVDRGSDPRLMIAPDGTQELHRPYAVLLKPDEAPRAPDYLTLVSSEIFSARRSGLQGSIAGSSEAQSGTAVGSRFYL